MAARRCAERLPDAPRVAVLARSCREIREYERTSTTVANAYVQAALPRYLERSQRRLAGARASPRPLLPHAVQRRPRHAGRRPSALPMRLLESGPAGGRARRRLLRRATRGAGALLAFDMGGTTAKVCLIDDGEPLIAREFEVGARRALQEGQRAADPRPGDRADRDRRRRRLASRASTRMRLPQGRARTAPAPSPGPACYGRGGTRAHRDRRRPRCSAISTRTTSSAARCARRRRGATRRSSRAWPSRSGCRVDRARPGASTRSSTRTWPAPRACTPSSAARTSRTYALFAFGGAAPVHAGHARRAISASRA